VAIRIILYSLKLMNLSINQKKKKNRPVLELQELSKYLVPNFLALIMTQKQYCLLTPRGLHQNLVWFEWKTIVLQAQASLHRFWMTGPANSYRYKITDKNGPVLNCFGWYYIKFDSFCQLFFFVTNLQKKEQILRFKSITKVNQINLMTFFNYPLKVTNNNNFLFSSFLFPMAISGNLLRASEVFNYPVTADTCNNKNQHRHQHDKRKRNKNKRKEKGLFQINLQRILRIFPCHFFNPGRHWLQRKACSAARMESS